MRRIKEGREKLYLDNNLDSGRTSEIMEIEAIEKIISRYSESDMIDLAVDYGLFTTQRSTIDIVIDIRDGKIFAQNYDLYGKDRDIKYEFTFGEISTFTDDDLEEFYNDDEDWDRNRYEYVNDYIDGENLDVESDLIMNNYIDVKTENFHTELNDMYQGSYYN